MKNIFCILTIGSLFILSSCSTRGGGEKLCIVSKGDQTNYGSVMYVDKENRYIYLMTPSSDKALLIDALHPESEFKSRSWPVSEYWEWKRSIATRPPEITQHMRDLIQTASSNGMVEYLMSHIDFEHLYHTLESTSDEQRGARLIWTGNHDAKITALKNMIHDLGDTVGSFYQIYFYTDEMYFGISQLMDDDAHEIYDGTYWPEGLFDQLNNTSDHPVVYYNGKLNGHQVVLTQFYSMDIFKYGSSDWPTFMTGRDGRVYLFTRKGLWYFSKNQKWEQPDILPIRTVTKASIEPAFFLNDEFIYVYGKSKDNPDWAIYRMKRSKL